MQEYYKVQSKINLQPLIEPSINNNSYTSNVAQESMIDYNNMNEKSLT